MAILIWYMYDFAEMRLTSSSQTKAEVLVGELLLRIEGRGLDVLQKGLAELDNPKSCI